MRLRTVTSRLASVIEGELLFVNIMILNDLLVFEGRVCKQNSSHTQPSTHTYDFTC